MVSETDILVSRFYEWEGRGRGHYLCDDPVLPEPCFTPFLGHYTGHVRFEDTSKHVGFFARLFKRKQSEFVYESDIPPPEGTLWKKDDLLCAIRLNLPDELPFHPERIEQLLIMLSDTRFPVSYEILSNGTTVSVQFVCRSRDYATVRSQLTAFFPEIVLSDTDSTLALPSKVHCVDFGLAYEFILPIRQSDKKTALDSYIGLFGALEIVHKGEYGAVQLLFQGTSHPWPESIMRAATDGNGGSFFMNLPELADLAEDKVAVPLFAVCVKVLGGAGNLHRATAISDAISQALVRLSESETNSLIQLINPGFAFVEDFTSRQTRRLGMLLNSKELVNILHLPSDAITSDKLDRGRKKTKTLPEHLRHIHPFVIGVNEHQGQQLPVTVPSHVRLRHTHLIGATGTGKSTLLLSMIAQDIANGNGLAVLDPHGDLIESVLNHIPRDRLYDVIVIDPADGEFPVGFNILSAHSEIEKDILSSDLVASFRRLSTSWGDQMNSVFANAILAFLEHEDGGTLVDLRRFLVEKGFRESFLKGVADPHVVYYWQHEYPLLKKQFNRFNSDTA